MCYEIVWFKKKVMASQESNLHTNSIKATTKLKFGIDRLLSSDTDNKTRIDNQFITKPQPTVAIPCSDCVTSLFRCCTLNPTMNGHDHHNIIGQQHRLLTPSSTYTIQPIRPFATRPGN